MHQLADKFQIEKVLYEYDLGEIISINDQSHGYANRNFSVECCKASVFVRFCNQQSIDNIQQEILLMSVLKKSKFRTAYPIARKDGAYLSFSNSIPVVVYEFLEGELPALNGEVTREIAGAIASLSKIKFPATLNKKNAISADDCRQIINSDAFRSFSYSDVKDNFIRLFKQLEEKIGIELPRGIVHGDVFPDNTLFNNNRLIALIDFEEFAIDHLMFDVGMTINGFCFEGLNLDMELLGAFIKKYNTVRQLSEKELAYFVDYMIWGAVGMTSWHLHQLLYRKNKMQLKRVRTLLERAKIIELDRSSLEKHISLLLR